MSDTPDPGLFARQQRQILDELAAMRAEMGRMSGRISIMDRRLKSFVDAARSGLDIAADLQNQIDLLSDRMEALEVSTKGGN